MYDLLCNGQTEVPLDLATHEGQLMCGKAQINEALRNMRSPQFADALNKMP